MRSRIAAETKQEIEEKTKRYQEEKQQLNDKCKELSNQIETLTGQLEQSKKIQLQQESELKDSKQNKELLSKVGKREKDILIFL